MASKRRIRRKACAGKRRYATPAEGVRTIKGLHRKFGYSQMDVYRCRFCTAYHIGHSGHRRGV